MNEELQLNNIFRGGYKVKPNFQDAIMGNTLTKEQLEDAAAKPIFLKVGAIGCALSHLEIYKKLLASREPYVFVFEDDARLSAAFFDDLAEIKSFMDTHTGQPCALILYKVKAQTKKVYNLENGDSILQTLGGTATHGYVINRKAAENILKAQTPVQFEIDAWQIYLKLGYLTLYCMNHDVVYLDSESSKKSTIEQVSVTNGPTPEFIRKAKNQHVNDLYNRYSFVEKCILQMRRVQRHIQELYYDKEK